MEFDCSTRITSVLLFLYTLLTTRPHGFLTRFSFTQDIDFASGHPGLDFASVTSPLNPYPGFTSRSPRPGPELGSIVPTWMASHSIGMGSYALLNLRGRA